LPDAARTAVACRASPAASLAARMIRPVERPPPGQGGGLDNICPRTVSYRFFITLTFSLKWALRPAFFFHNSHL
jgi:hypothetical protein